MPRERMRLGTAGVSLRSDGRRPSLRSETPSVPRHLRGTLTLSASISSHTMRFATLLYKSYAIAIHERLRPLLP